MLSSLLVDRDRPTAIRPHWRFRSLGRGEWLLVNETGVAAHDVTIAGASDDEFKLLKCPKNKQHLQPGEHIAFRIESRFRRGPVPFAAVVGWREHPEASAQVAVLTVEEP
ncbi:hypothetical protein [Desertivibrio insolitus]|uniref:hypothetical protein n=1 Tax=Herbiconiux sp. SYSU D00978 TaxID=2812562 RepID=UPI001A963CDA|nr:hypothetical protein [Herbiconiux sp. SYSU D00978]